MIYKPFHENDSSVSLTDTEFEEAKDFGGRMYMHSQKKGYKDYRAFVRKGVDGQRVNWK